MTPLSKIRALQNEIIDLAEKNEIGVVCIVIEPGIEGDIHSKWVGVIKEVGMALRYALNSVIDKIKIGKID